MLGSRLLCRVWAARAHAAQFEHKKATDGMEADSAEIASRLDEINVRLARLESLAQGGRAVNVGNGRLLVRCDIGFVRAIYFVDADDLLIVPNLIADGVYEPEVSRFVVANVKETDHCLDVGANFGYYTCIMAKRAWKGRVVAVEADPQTWLLLRDNIYANWCERVASALNIAAADRVGMLRLFRRKSRSGNTSIIEIDSEALAAYGEPPATPFSIESMPIDSLLPKFDGRIDIVKIDVEGAEPLAFRGVSQTVGSNRLIKFVVEWSPGQMQAAGFDVGNFVDEVEKLGLQPHLISGEHLSRISWSDLRSADYFSAVVLARQPLE